MSSHGQSRRWHQLGNTAKTGRLICVVQQLHDALHDALRIQSGAGRVVQYILSKLAGAIVSCEYPVETGMYLVLWQ